MVKDGLSVHNAHFLALPYLVGLGSLAFICGVRLAWPAGYGSPPPVPFFPPVQNQLARIFFLQSRPVGYGSPPLLSHRTVL